jgi:PKD repeat protein
MVQFTDLSLNSPTSWNWMFGDGGVSTAQNPVHLYASVGTFAVSLNATNGDGSNTTTKAGFITVNALVPPAANFSTNVTIGPAQLTIRFTDTSIGSPTVWNWSFGDGSFSDSQNPVHSYTRPGTYSVSLNITNAVESNTTVKFSYITVFPKGDFNRNWRVDIGDVTTVAYMAVNLTSHDPRADFTNDGKVDVSDAAKIAWYYVGKVVEL